jgi:hypothetical protein
MISIRVSKYGNRAVWAECWNGCTEQDHAYVCGRVPPRYPMPATLEHAQWSRFVENEAGLWHWFDFAYDRRWYP